jgi:hypothetical protein
MGWTNRKMCLMLDPAICHKGHYVNLRPQNPVLCYKRVRGGAKWESCTVMMISPFMVTLWHAERGVNTCEWPRDTRRPPSRDMQQKARCSSIVTAVAITLATACSWRCYYTLPAQVPVDCWQQASQQTLIADTYIASFITREQYEWGGGGEHAFHTVLSRQLFSVNNS